jgi:CRISPR-associated protein (Cas_Cmr3)
MSGEMQGFTLRPFDVIWLRTGHPFVAGENSSDQVLFPPTHWTWQGMVRTALLDRQPDLNWSDQQRIKALVGPPESLPLGWRLRGPWPALQLPEVDGPWEPWLPWPAFLSGPDPELAGLAPLRSHELAGAGRLVGRDQDAKLLGWAQGRGAAQGWLSARNLLWALLGLGEWQEEGASRAEKTRASSGALPPFVAEEPRTGLELDIGPRRGVDHMLYTATFHRFAPGAGLWGGLVGGPPLAGSLTQGATGLGRRGRQAGLEPGPLLPGLSQLLEGRHLRKVARSAEVQDLRLLLLSHALVPPQGGLPFDLPPGVKVMAIQGREGPAIGGLEQHSSGRSRPARSTWAAGSSFWLRIGPQWSRPDDRLGLLQQLSGLAGPWTEEERMGAGQRVLAPFCPSTGEAHPICKELEPWLKP